MLHLHMHSRSLTIPHTMDPNHCHQTREGKRPNMEKEKEKRRLQGEVEASGPSPPSSSTSSSSSMANFVAAVATSPPPSSSSSSATTSSPSHDFTFTISLYPSPPKGPNKSPARSRNPANAIDLAPADDIFFNGHLLPLRLLTRPPFSPRRSSAENRNVTISFNKTPAEQRKSCNDLAERPLDAGERMKASRSFPSLLTGLTKWRREEDEEDRDRDKKKDAKKKKKKKFEMKRMLKRYANLVETLLFSRGVGRERRRRDCLSQRPNSFSGVTSPWSRGRGGGADEEDWRRSRRRGKKRWGQFSAPASMRTSPTNSGLLAAPPPSLGSSDESTMEELQNAIQAAIAHCKNSMNNNTVREGGGEVQVVVDDQEQGGKG